MGDVVALLQPSWLSHNSSSSTAWRLLCGSFAGVGAALLWWRWSFHAGERRWHFVGRSSQLASEGPEGWRVLTFDATPVGVRLDAAALRRDADGRWVAFTRACPHQNVDLLTGDIEDLGDGPIISCPAHAYLFDTQSGACLWDACEGEPPKTGPLTTFDVWESPFGGVWVRLNDAPEPVSHSIWDQEHAQTVQKAVYERIYARNPEKAAAAIAGEEREYGFSDVGAWQQEVEELFKGVSEAVNETLLSLRGGKPSVRLELKEIQEKLTNTLWESQANMYSSDKREHLKKLMEVLEPLSSGQSWKLVHPTEGDALRERINDALDAWDP